MISLGKNRDNVDDLAGQARRVSDFPLHLCHQVLTLIPATHVVELRGAQAIRGAGDIIRDDHTGLAREGFIEGAHCSKVLDALHKLPLRVCPAAVEIIQTYTTAAGQTRSGSLWRASSTFEQW